MPSLLSGMILPLKCGGKKYFKKTLKKGPNDIKSHCLIMYMNSSEKPLDQKKQIN